MQARRRLELVTPRTGAVRPRRSAAGPVVDVVELGERLGRQPPHGRRLPDGAESQIAHLLCRCRCQWGSVDPVGGAAAHRCRPRKDKAGRIPPRCEGVSARAAAPPGRLKEHDRIELSPPRGVRCYSFIGDRQDRSVIASAAAEGRAPGSAAVAPGRCRQGETAAMVATGAVAARPTRGRVATACGVEARTVTPSRQRSARRTRRA